MSIADTARVKELVAKVAGLEARIALLERAVAGITQAQPAAPVARRVLGVAQGKSPI